MKKNAWRIDHQQYEWTYYMIDLGTGRIVRRFTNKTGRYSTDLRMKKLAAEYSARTGHVTILAKAFEVFPQGEK